MPLTAKKITVVGMARSGVGAANLLEKMGADVTVTDMKPASALEVFVKEINPSVKLALGNHPTELFTEADMIVVSPGVPLEIKPLELARSKGIPVIGELELAYRIVRSEESGVRSKDDKIVRSQENNPSPPFIAITGSNGKSTTTTLVDYMLRKAGKKTMLGGNIGNALTSEIVGAGSPRPSFDFIVVEVSSFQLEAIDTFRPHISAILNITPDHLDRYHSIDEYAEAKARIFENQTKEDYLVLNADDPETMKIYNSRFKIQDSRLPSTIFFSRTKECEGVYLKDGSVYMNIPDSSLLYGRGHPAPTHSSLISAAEIRIKGVHNLENAMAASAMALLAGCPVEAIRDALKEFPGLEHRLEFVRELDGVRYINDSKGTNVGAVIKSIESFKEPVILIAGGRDKAGDFSMLRGSVSKQVKAIVLIGEAAEKIRKALSDITETVAAGDLKHAVDISRSMAAKGDVVLMSPACASFDMFLDFEDRGRQFKKIVMELEK